jgi:Bacterial protein of unknown function (DUF916)
MAGTALVLLAGLLAVGAPASARAGTPDRVGTAKGSVTNATFGAAPAGPKKADGLPYFTFDSSPGGQTTDHVAVTNYSTRRLTLSVYTVDAIAANNGAIAFQTHGAPRLEAGAWLAVGTPHGSGKVTLKPRSSVVLPVHVVIPRNAPPGDHVGAVIVSLAGRVSGSFGQGGQTNSKLEQRIAVRAVFRISGPLRPDLTIGQLKAKYSGLIDPFAKGHATVTYVVHNGGNVVLGGPQTVTINGLLGEKVAGPAIAEVPPLLPGASYPVSVRVPGVYPEGLMTAKVDIDPAGLQGEIDPGLHPVTSSVHFLAIPWIPLVVVLLLILGLAGAYARRRRRKRRLAVPSSRAAEAKEPRGVPQTELR